MNGVKTFSMVHDMKSVIGKPIEFPSLPKPQYKSDGKAINWNDFNYPPLLRIIHYDPAELPDQASNIARCLNVTFCLVALVSLLNFFNNCIIVSVSSAPWTWVLQSLIHLVLMPGAAFLLFYVGYSGIAEQDVTMLGRFTAGQLVLIFLSVFVSLVPFGCLNGFFKLKVLGNLFTTAPSPVFVILILVESSLWLAIAALAVATLRWMRRYDRQADMDFSDKSGVHA